MSKTVGYEQVDAEVRELALALVDAEPTAVAAASARLQRLAEQIPDPLWRARALQRARRLPDLVAGPAAGTSEQYRQATRLAGRAMALHGPVETVAVELDSSIQAIGELSRQAPAEEGATILRLNSALSRLGDELRNQSGSPL